MLKDLQLLFVQAVHIGLILKSLNDLALMITSLQRIGTLNVSASVRPQRMPV